MPPRSTKDKTDGQPLLFIPVQPQISRSTSKPLRTAAKKHVLLNRPRNFPREASLGLAESEPGDIGKRLSRFRLDGKNPRDYTHRQLKSLAARPISYNNPSTDTESRCSLSTPSRLLGDLPIQDSFTSYRRDPFIVFPIDADNRVQNLFAYYLNDFNNEDSSANPKRDFVPVVLGNAACFHVLMTSLLQYQFLQGGSGGAWFWHHRGAAIRSLNQELSSHDGQITDTMFLTVMMLLYVESRIPDLRAQTASMHIVALIRFLEMRKGKLKTELYCMLLGLSIWCNINPPLTRPPKKAPTHDRHFDFELKLPCDDQKYTSYPQDIFVDFRLLVHQIKDLDEEDERNNCIYKDILSRCLKNAATSLSTPQKASVLESNVVRCILLGHILFLLTDRPSMSVSGFYSQSIAMALRRCLETGWSASGDSVIWSPDVLCWLLFNGAITQPVKSPLYEWYVSRLFEFTRTQRLQGFDQLEYMLRRVVWTEEYFGSSCRSVGKEIFSDT